MLEEEKEVVEEEEMAILVVFWEKLAVAEVMPTSKNLGQVGIINFKAKGINSGERNRTEKGIEQGIQLSVHLPSSALG